MKFYQITIDGPSGVGKSTLAKKLSLELGFININTGKIFRVISWYMIKKNISSKKEVISSIEESGELIFKEQGASFQKKQIPIEELKNSKISKLSSEISQDADIRKFILNIEKKLAEFKNIVIEGRDIGTNVFPNADLKIYLNADLESRAKWRHKELQKLNILEEKSYEEIKEEIYKRDKHDTFRKLNPLKKADDAIEIDSSKASIDELVIIVKNLFLTKISLGSVFFDEKYQPIKEKYDGKLFYNFSSGKVEKLN